VEIKMSVAAHPLDALESAEVEGTKFRLTCKRIHLTYKSHINLDTLLDYLNTISLNKVVQWSGCQEIGSSDYAHTHIGIEFHSKPDFKCARIFDFDGVHPHIRKVTSAAHWDNILTYHTKEPVTFKTNRVSQPKKKKTQPKVIKGVSSTGVNFSENPTVTDVLSYNTAGEALRGINDLKLVGGILAAFEYKERIMPVEPDNVWWLPWQAELRIELQGESDDRRFIWYYDKPGDSGKSLFAEHAQAYWSNTLVLTTVNSRDVATILEAVLKKGANIEIIIIDLSRSNKKEINKPALYAALEQLKNGLVTATKYRGGTIVIPRAHIVVFSNTMPLKEMAVKKSVVQDDGMHTIEYVMEPTVSEDRWDIRTLGLVDDPRTNEKSIGVLHRELAPRKYAHKIPDGYVKPGLQRK
jgi:hypothetical protein